MDIAIAIVLVLLVLGGVLVYASRFTEPEITDDLRTADAHAKARR